MWVEVKVSTRLGGWTHGRGSGSGAVVALSPLAPELTTTLILTNASPLFSPLLLSSPLCVLLQYPATIQTVAFDVQHVDVLHARTQQGLPVILGATFQVRTYPAVEVAVAVVTVVVV